MLGPADEAAAVYPAERSGMTDPGYRVSCGRDRWSRLGLGSPGVSGLTSEKVGTARPTN